METATQQGLRIDVKRNRAIQQATQLIHELSQAGYIADFCRSAATYRLADLFYKHGVEITTEEQRRVDGILGQ